MNNIVEKEIWVFADIRNDHHFGYCLNILSKGRELSKAVSGKIAAVLMGFNSEQPGNLTLQNYAEKCIEHGADFVYILENKAFTEKRADIYSYHFSDFIKKRRPWLVLFGLTDFSKELASRTTAYCNAGLIADCIDIRVEKNTIIAVSPSWGGEIIAELSFSDDFQTGFATLRPNVFKPCNIKGEPGEIKWEHVQNLSLPDYIEKNQLFYSEKEICDSKNLEEADIVVVGGAGVGSIEDFRLVRELAAAIGGEVGATRPPVLQHWIDSNRMIGQTGKTVRPKLLISIGTSGAIQYTAGIIESKTIVAINRDQDAPIYHVADIGIVGDVKQLLPILINKLRKNFLRQLADAVCHDNMLSSTDSFGAKIRKLREAHCWTLENLSHSTGQSPDFIEQVENDQISPSVSFILSVARALNVDPGTFLSEEEKIKIRDQRAQEFIKRTQNYSYQTLTPSAEHQHLRAFMINIEPKQAHKPVAYKHEGEEFIFVMDGELELTLGNKINHLKPAESIHFNSEIPHKLKSLSNNPTRCLVVLYTI
ncbi:MAG: cupin domain-containing protein [Desulfobacterales bacterium]|nr:cupin domain-containing protein [Desulfobacterales bacterium]